MSGRDGITRTIHNVSWERFEHFLATKGDSPVPRITYLDGVFEIMTPSRIHEGTSSWLAMLLGIYALERGIKLSAFGSWTLKDELQRAGAEPDECYILGAFAKRKRPDFVIEVQHSRRGIQKLEVYKRLGVTEVWFWPKQSSTAGIDVHILRAGTWKLAKRSRKLPELDLDLLCSCLDRSTMTDAMFDYRAALSSSTLKK